MTVKSNLISHVKRIAVMRPTGSPANFKVREYIRGEMESLGWIVDELSIPKTRFDSRGGTSLICRRQVDFTRPALILAAHHDHPWGPGADDNASGCAGIIELARLLNDDEYEARHVNPILCFYDREETGFVGSAQHASLLKNSGIDVFGMVAVDMIGYSRAPSGKSLTAIRSMRADLPVDRGGFVSIESNDDSIDLWSCLQLGMESVPDLDCEVHPSKRGPDPYIVVGDHASFHREDFRCAYLGDTAFFRNPNWHTTRDTIDTLDFNFMEQITYGLASSVVTVSDHIDLNALIEL